MRFTEPCLDTTGPSILKHLFTHYTSGPQLLPVLFAHVSYGVIYPHTIAENRLIQTRHCRALQLGVHVSCPSPLGDRHSITPSQNTDIHIVSVLQYIQHGLLCQPRI